MRQVLAITLLNLRTMTQRPVESLVVCIGVAAVVGVLITVLAMATGLEKTVLSAGDDGRAIVLREGARFETLSLVPLNGVLAIETAPGIARDDDGPLVSPELVWNETFDRADVPGLTSAAVVRGVTERMSAVRPAIRVSQGRWFEPGLHELVVGRQAAERFAGFGIGDTLNFLGTDWRIVGWLESGGNVHESELLADVRTLMSAAVRRDYSSVTVVLADAQGSGALTEVLAEDPTLDLVAQNERTFYEEQSENVSQLLYFVAYVVGSIMAVGALFGALNMMYSAVSARAVEIATLRAVGFGAGPVVVSVLVEALVLSLAGALLGVFVAWVVFDGDSFSSGGIFGQVAMRLNVGGDLLATGAIWSVVIGMIGGLFPAVRSARLTVSAALRVLA